MISISGGQEANRGRSKLKLYLLKSKVCCIFLEIKIVPLSLRELRSIAVVQARRFTV